MKTDRWTPDTDDAYGTSEAPDVGRRTPGMPKYHFGRSETRTLYVFLVNVVIDALSCSR